MWGRDRIEYKTPEQVLLMRRAGLVVAEALAATVARAAPGVTTADLDAVAGDVVRAAGATPSFLGYHGYPATLCVSVNDEVVHGIPGSRRLADGDVVSIDCGAIVDGWHGDAAVTVVAGAADPLDDALVAATRSALWDGIAALHGADRLSAVGEAVEDAVVGRSYGIVEEYTGHGIGSAMHQAPDVLNYRSRDRGPRVRAGMCLAVEPMVTRGGGAVHELDDGWTVVTDDGSRAAHWEHTVAVLDDGLWVLTAHDGGRGELEARGVPVAGLAADA